MFREIHVGKRAAAASFLPVEREKGGKGHKESQYLHQNRTMLTGGRGGFKGKKKKHHRINKKTVSEARRAEKPLLSREKGGKGPGGQQLMKRERGSEKARE